MPNESLLLVIDRLENANAMLQSRGLPDALHVQAIREILPEIIIDLRGAINADPS